jgi:hypothetical protein
MDTRVLYGLERTFKKIGIRSTMSMLESERRHHDIKILELQHDGSRNATDIKDRCKEHIEYINRKLNELHRELQELQYE